MGVDNKYHVASLVAVFFALALGVLVGVSLSSHENDIHSDWVQAIEREMHTLRADNKSAAALLKEISNEKDSLQSLADTLMTFALSGNLEGRKITFVRIGEQDRFDGDAIGTAYSGQVVANLESIFKAAHASIVSYTEFPDDAIHRSTESENLDASADNLNRPAAVLLVEGPPDRYGDQVNETVDRLMASEMTRIVAVSAGYDEWKNTFSARGIPYVSHPQTIYGMLSIVLLANSDDQGAYGHDTQLYEKLWPDHLLKW